MAGVDRLFRAEGRRPDAELSDRFSALCQRRKPRASHRLRRLLHPRDAHLARISESDRVPPGALAFLRASLGSSPKAPLTKLREGLARGPLWALALLETSYPTALTRL